MQYQWYLFESYLANLIVMLLVLYGHSGYRQYQPTGRLIAEVSWVGLKIKWTLTRTLWWWHMNSVLVISISIDVSIQVSLISMCDCVCHFWPNLSYCVYVDFCSFFCFTLCFLLSFILFSLCDMCLSLCFRVDDLLAAELRWRR